MLNFVSALALCSVLLLIFVGTTCQIWENYQRKSVEGLSLPFFLLSFAAWVSWAWYGVLKEDKLLIWTQAIGALMTAIVLIQFLIYRR